MSETKKLNEKELDVIVAGDGHITETGTVGLDAIIRSGPGFEYPEVLSVVNGTWVNTTGEVHRADGRTWYCVNVPCYGWIAGSIIGMPDRY